jgi:hypothetical protein
MAGINVNPILTQNFPGTFSTISQGYTQGIIVDDPVNIYRIAGGTLKSDVAVPIYAGMAISEYIPTNDDVRGSNIGLAASSSVLNITGFTVGNKSHNAIITNSGNVPILSAGASVQYCRFGSGIRLALACDPALASLDGGLVTQQVSWDFTNQQIVPYQLAEAQIAITSITWSSGVASVVASAATTIVAGSWFTISGAVPAGYNGDFKALAAADTTHFTFALAANPGSETTPGVILAGGGAVPFKQVLKVAPGNSRVAVYDAVANTVNYNNSGCCALVIL